MGNWGSSGNGAKSSTSQVAAVAPSVVVRRLNRAEYINSIQDLFAVSNVQPSDLPVDTESYGFDNVGSGLTLVPADAMSYEGVAEKVVALAATPGSAAYTQWVTCNPNTVGISSCLNTVLTNMALHVWRRPPASDDMAGLMQLANAAAATSDPFGQGLQQGMLGLLMSPYFLFKIETDPSDSTSDHAVDAYELATRLSYFLWSTTPDQALLDAAADNSLLQDGVLTQQVQRMLTDPKIIAFSTNFAGQWLMIRQAELVQPSLLVYPTFDANLQTSMVQETTAFFNDFLLNNAPLSQLLTANYSFINDRLAQHYGLPAVNSNTVVKTTLPAGMRQGLMTQASVLTVTSQADHGSPVLRGKYILAQLLCQPPPPPPANVPPLPAFTTASGVTMRQRMENHVSNATCAACHSSMDMLGYAYEGFDGIGMARTTDNGAPVDTTGTLPWGPTFTGPFDMATILSKDTRLPNCMVQQLFTYALGRGPTTSDNAVIQSWTNGFVQGGTHLQDLIQTVVLSSQFRTRHGGTP